MATEKLRFNELGQRLVKCGLCGTDTTMTATRRCDGCWELETRIQANPELARRILGPDPARAVLRDCIEPLEGLLQWLDRECRYSDMVAVGDLLNRIRMLDHA